MKKNFQKKEYPRSSRNQGKFTKPVNKFNKLTCFECGDTDHIVKKLSSKKKEFLIKRDNGKKAMVATWSDSDSSDTRKVNQ